jgi:glutamyl-tRNA synthetase
MIVARDGRPLSKRHGDVSVGSFREKGYLPEAMVNFLALLGWSLDDSTTIMDRTTLVENFSLERVSSKPAVWDEDKLLWMNSQYITALDDRELAGRIFPFLVREGLVEESDAAARELLVKAAPLIRERIKLLADAVHLVRFLFQEVEIEEDARQVLEEEAAEPVLREAGKALLELKEFKAPQIEGTLRAMADRLGLKPRQAFQPLRVAITGRKVSPPLFESMELVGRERCLQRIARALEAL